MIPLERFTHGSWWHWPEGNTTVEIIGRPFWVPGPVPDLPGYWACVVDRHHRALPPLTTGTTLCVALDCLCALQHRHAKFLEGCGRHLILDDECYMGPRSDRMSGRGRVSVVRDRLGPWIARRTTDGVALRDPYKCKRCGCTVSFGYFMTNDGDDVCGDCWEKQ
jgi:hypothetical protein